MALDLIVQHVHSQLEKVRGPGGCCCWPGEEEEGSVCRGEGAAPHNPEGLIVTALFTKVQLLGQAEP